MDCWLVKMLPAGCVLALLAGPVLAAPCAVLHDGGNLHSGRLVLGPGVRVTRAGLGGTVSTVTIARGCRLQAYR